jgi:uncharacterized protein YhjY with autotransporter beta-barrel domain
MRERNQRFGRGGIQMNEMMRSLLLVALVLIGTLTVASRVQAQIISTNCDPAVVSDCTSFAVSQTESLAFNPAIVTTTNVTAYSTRIIGSLQNGAMVYDQTFAVPFSDPAAQAGVADARAAIIAAGGPGVVVGSPALTAKSSNTVSSSVDNYSRASTQTADNTVITFGPNTIIIGRRSACNVGSLPGPTRPTCQNLPGISYALAIGETNFNTITNTQHTIDQATAVTNTTTISEQYTLTGSIRTAPVANNDAYATNQDTPLTVAAPGILANDTDADSDPLVAGSFTAPANGTVSGNANGSFTYTPNTGYSGTDSFTYTASDGTLTSNVATVTIAVSSAPPTLSGISPASGPTAGGTLITITGNRLSGATGVTVGGVAATGVTVVSDTQMTAVTPSRPAGPVDVSVTTPRGTATLPAAFTYIAPTTAFTFSPPSGPLPGATAGIQYSQAITVTGGTAPYSFSATGLPVGIAIDPQTGTLYGAPTTPGSYTIVVTARDQNGQTGSATYSLSVGGTFRPDPSLDAEVIGLLNAQAQTVKRFATVQISNFNDRLERLHNDQGRYGQSLNVRMGGTPDSNRTEPLGYAGEAPGNDPAVQATHLPQAGAAQPEDPVFGATAIWAGGFVNFGTSDRGSIDLDHTLVGVSGGVDHRFTPDFVGGVGFGFGRDKTDVGINGTESEGRAFSAALYGSYHPLPFYLDGLLGVSRLDFDSTRFVTSSGDFATGSRDGSQIFGSLSAGYEHREDGFLFSPYGRIDAAFTRLDGFTETGAGLQNLAVGSQSFDMVAGVIGMRAEYAIPLNWGALNTRGRLEYTHDFAGSSQASVGYADRGTLPYTLNLDDYMQDYLTVGLGVDARLDNQMTLGLDYQTALGFDGNAQSHMFGIRVGSKF